jgi:hypothetical protein
MDPQSRHPGDSRDPGNGAADGEIWSYLIWAVTPDLGGHP